MMAKNLQRLMSEYCAIEEMDRMLRQAPSVNETDLFGLTARAIRRREILDELTVSISAAEEELKRIP
jgi:hypothetical protein